MNTFESDNQEKVIALYCRVSTDEQAREGVSLEEQQERLSAYCRAMGWNSQIKLFVDDGYSAKDLDRPKLKKLIKEVGENKIAKVLVTKLDRMSRKLLDLLTLIDSFHERNVSFVSISESFDTNTPSGRLTLQVLGAVAEFERERIRERVIDNMMHSARQGKWLTQAPYGYRLEDKELIVHEEEAKVVRSIYDLYINKGYGFYTIAKQLNEEGIPSKFHKEWSIRGVKLLLTNPVYKGALVWNRVDSSKKTRKNKNEEEWVTVEDALPVIIDKGNWDKAQKRIGKKQLASRAQSSPHLLGGLLKCGKCGGGMSIGWSGSKNNRYRVYRCSNNKNKGICTSKQYRAKEVESWVKEGLRQLIESLDIHSSPRIMEKIAEQKTQSKDKQIRNAKKRYERKVEAYTAGLIELDSLKQEKRHMEKLIEEANSKYSEEEDVDIDTLHQELTNRITNVLDAIDQISVVDAKQLLSTVIEHVTIKGPENIEIMLTV